MTIVKPRLVLLSRALAAFALVIVAATAQAKKPAPAATEEAEETAAEEDTDDTKDKPAKEESDEAETEEKSEPEEKSETEDKPEPEEESPAKEKTPAEEPYARFWLGVSGGLDIAFMPSGNDLCRLNPDGTIMNSIHAFCTDPAGRDFPIRGYQYPVGMPRGGAGSLDGGVALGNYRVLLSFDYAVTPFLLVGARAGYVGNSYPGHAGMGGRPSFTRHVHGEVRGTYLLGDAPLSRVGFAPLAFVAFGYGQYDAGKGSTISYEGIAASEDVTIWIVSGPWFASLGAGARYQFSARAAFTAAARGNVSFGPLGSLLTAGPEVAFLYGF